MNDRTRGGREKAVRETDAGSKSQLSIRSHALQWIYAERDPAGAGVLRTDMKPKSKLLKYSGESLDFGSAEEFGLQGRGS